MGLFGRRSRSKGQEQSPGQDQSSTAQSRGEENNRGSSSDGNKPGDGSGAQGGALQATRWKTSLEANLDLLRDAYAPGQQLKFRHLSINGRAMALAYFFGMVDERKVTEGVLEPLMAWAQTHPGKHPTWPDLENSILAVINIFPVQDLQRTTHPFLTGNALILLDGSDQVMAVAVAGYPKRHPSAPQVDPAIRGPKEALTETLVDNLSMIRRTLPDHRLRMDMVTVGERGFTQVCIAYIQDIADPDLVAEVNRRVNDVHTDAILETRALEEWIQDHPWSPFPQMMDTERIDAVAAALLHGQVVILVDRTPHALILPVTIFEFFRTSSDYAQPPIFATFVRWIRFFSFMLSFTLPALYVALIGFNPEVIPTKLALSIVGTRQGIPFPAVFEVLVLDIMMEVLREATVRMPRNVGQTIGVVGGIVLGTAVVQAGIVSNIMLIIVAMSAVASFATANYTFSLAARILKYALLVPAVLMGLVGYVGGLALILMHICTLESFGVPYTSPMAPLHPRDMKDTLVRAPSFMLTARGSTMHTSDAVRAGKRPRTDRQEAR